MHGADAAARTQDSFVDEQIAILSDLVLHIFGRTGTSLTVYGRAATPQFNRDADPIRTVVVLDEIKLADLRRLAEHGPKLGAQQMIAPLIMTPGYIVESLDTFPLELIDIQQRHRTIVGSDHFADLSFADADVRLQCERELKVLAIQMRQGLLAAGGRERSLADVEIGAGELLLRTLRGILWIKGQRDALPDDDVISRVESIVDRKLTGARNALNVLSDHGYDQFSALYDDIGHLGAAVNAW